MSHTPRKRFGQNFLHDRHVVERIVAAIAPRDGERLVEIGPGQGALTLPLLERIGELDAVELDRDLIPLLREKAAGVGTLRIHEADALRFDFAALAAGGPLRVVGNLPYNISTPLIFHLLAQAGSIRDMHFMLQKEVVERMSAVPGGGDYGRLSVMVQLRCRVVPLFTVPPGAFYPAPKVDSMVVRLVPYGELPVRVEDAGHFEFIVRHAFAQRRKTLRNNLKGWLDADRIAALGIDPGIRPEQLDLSAFAALACAYTSLQEHGESAPEGGERR